MKTIGIIGAMEEEISTIKNRMEVVSAKKIVGVDFFLGKMDGKNIVLVRCGIGKVNAAICTQVLIDLYAVDYVINVGVAGALSKDLSIGDVVVSTDLVQHDMDASAFGDPVGTIPRMAVSHFTADTELIRIARQAGAEVHAQVIPGRIASGDQFISDNAAKERIYSLFKAQCVEMEGAAIAHACYLNKIPFIVIRAISDCADNNATMSFDTFVVQAARISGQMVEVMVRKL